MDTLKSIWQDLSDRLKSPFLIAFVITWILWNWALLYAVSNFNPGSTLDFKLNYIQNYFAGNRLEISVCPFITAFLGTLIFYVTKLAYLWIDTSYENKWRVKVIEFVGLSKMVPKEDLIALHAEISSLNNQLDSKIRDFARSSSIINELQSENARVRLLESEIEIRKAELVDANSKLESLSSVKSEIVLHDSLDYFFKGTWICEYNLIDGNSVKPNFGYEKFSIKKEDYIVEGKMSFIISNVKFYDSIRCLSFMKNRFDKVNFINIVKVFKVNEYLWVGVELTGDGKLSYMRFYPFDRIPVHIPVVLPFASNSDRSLLQLYMNNFDTVVSYLQRMKETDGDSMPSYNSSESRIVVNEAMYGADGDYVNLTKEISDLVAREILEFEVGNWLVNGQPEPAYGKEKNLKVNCSVDGVNKVLVARERTVFKFRQ